MSRNNLDAPGKDANLYEESSPTKADRQLKEISMFPKYRCKNCQASYSEHLKSEELVGQTLEMLSSGYANFECEGVLTQVRVAGGAKHAQMFSLIAHICKYPRDGEIGIAELIGFTREHPPN